MTDVSETSVIGPLWDPGQLERDVIRGLKLWLPSYLNEVAWQETQRREIPALRDANDDLTDDQLLDLLKEKIDDSEIKPYQLKTPESWGVASEYDRFPEDGLPAIIVAASGMPSRPEGEGDGSISGDWVIEVSATVSSTGAARTRRAGQLYLTAIIASILQRRSLSTPYGAVDLGEVDYLDIPSEKRKTLFTAAAGFTVQVADMLNTRGGPATATPPDPMPLTWPEVTEITTETEIE